MAETTTSTQERSPGPAAKRARVDWRTPVRWAGLASLLVAAGLAGYVAWLLWGTGLETARAQHELRQGFEGTIGTRDPSAATTTLPGGAYTEIVIPALDLDMIVVQGTGYDQLKEGPGHYPDTANPWDPTGRVGIAGHRTTYLAPFFHLDDLRRGDPIELRSPYGTFRYSVRRVFVIPSAGSGSVLAQTPGPTLVLTTCNPIYASYERLIVTAVRL
jgi:sortase A